MVTSRVVGSGRGADQDLVGLDGESPVVTAGASHHGAFVAPSPARGWRDRIKTMRTGRDGVVVTLRVFGGNDPATVTVVRRPGVTCACHRIRVSRR